MIPAIEIHGLSVVYSESSRAVDALDLQVEDGEFFGLLGPNGAGKTSVISSITGLLPIQYGEVKVFGEPAGSKAAKRILGIVPQELVHHGFFTVEEVLKFYSGYYGIWKNQNRIEYLLESLQLAEHRKKRVSQLSGGMKRRLLIAKALVHSPKLLLLDEPSAGVDIELRAILWDFILELNKQGTTILLTTHYLEEAERLCSRLAIMDRGKLLALESTRSLILEKSEKIIRLKLSNPDRKISGGEFLSSQWKEGEWVVLQVTGVRSMGEVLKSLNIPLQEIIDLQVQEGALEHAFLKVLRGGM